VGEVDTIPDFDGCADCDAAPLSLRDDTDEKDGRALSVEEMDCECETVGLDSADSDPLCVAAAVADDDRDARCEALPEGEGVGDKDTLSVLLAVAVVAGDVVVEK
jgi:hypothetical protein